MSDNQNDYRQRSSDRLITELHGQLSTFTNQFSAAIATQNAVIESLQDNFIRLENVITASNKPNTMQWVAIIGLLGGFFVYQVGMVKTPIDAKMEMISTQLEQQHQILMQQQAVTAKIESIDYRIDRLEKAEPPAGLGIRLGIMEEQMKEIKRSGLHNSNQ